VTRFAVGLGSNEGDRLRILREAIGSIEERYGKVLVSSIYETEPVAGPEQGPYLNAVVTFETDESPEQLLTFLQRVEADHGRKRTIRWGPRTLDLDIITYDGPWVSEHDLILPHPRADDREFVLRPLVEIWPQAVVARGVRAEDALESIDSQGVDLLARSWYPRTPGWVPSALVTGQFIIFLVTAVALAFDGTLPEGNVTVLRVVGAALAMGGMILAFIASRRLGPAMTPSPVPKENGSLVIAGPYRYARHPIYGGVSLVLMGTALFLDSIAGFAVAALLLPYFWIKSTYEERQLRMRYAGYRTYRQVVHRRLIPFLL
jgi:2-amino-4-hydroxy-6-hydroxymethyldihydropteridine diphosphokinase